MAITIKSRKQKGRLFQQEIAKRISKLLGIQIEKDGEVESRPLPQKGTDVILRGEALKKFPFSIEAKRTENISLYSWIEQAKRNKADKTNWLLFHKKNHSKAIVILSADAFFRLYDDYLLYQENYKKLVEKL